MITQLARRRAAAVATAFGLALFGMGQPAIAASSGQGVVADAEVVVESMLGDPEMPGMSQILAASHGVLIVPSLTRGGIGIGGEGGTGVLLTRTETGWSNPVFIDLAGVSIGPQIGVETVAAVMAIRDKDTLEAILDSGIKLGADASVAAGNRGARAEATASHKGQGDITLFSRSEGVFAGAALKGVRVAPDDRLNAEYYGRAVSVGDIVSGRAEAQGAAALKAALPAGS